MNVLPFFNLSIICHDESVFNQLVYGIRYLDLRVSYEPVKDHAQKLWIVHGILRTQITLDNVLQQVKRFLDATTHEVVIIDFHRFEKGFDDHSRDESINVRTGQRHDEVVVMVKKYLEAYLSADEHGYRVKLGDLIKANKRLVVGYAANHLVRRASFYPRVRKLLSLPVVSIDE